MEQFTKRMRNFAENFNADAMRKVIRLFFIVAFLCNILGSGMGVRAQGFLATEEIKNLLPLHPIIELFHFT